MALISTPRNCRKSKKEAKKSVDFYIPFFFSYFTFLCCLFSTHNRIKTDLGHSSRWLLPHGEKFLPTIGKQETGMEDVELLLDPEHLFCFCPFKLPNSSVRCIAVRFAQNTGQSNKIPRRFVYKGYNIEIYIYAI